MFDWNDMRYFLELQRSGRLLTAAKRLNTTHSTVARHIESIEQHLGAALFVQHAQGYELTPAGQALLKHAEAMENVALLAQEEINQSLTPLGKIRLGVTEGIGIMFIAPRLRGLFERYPGLEVELVAVPRFVSILNREAEISIHLDRPNADLLITRKLTDYRLPTRALRQPSVSGQGTASDQPRRSGKPLLDRLRRRPVIQSGTAVSQHLLPHPDRDLSQHQRDCPTTSRASRARYCRAAQLYGR